VFHRFAGDLVEGRDPRVTCWGLVRDTRPRHNTTCRPCSCKGDSKEDMDDEAEYDDEEDKDETDGHGNCTPIEKRPFVGL
jgi:hypothetical protein